MSNLHGDSVFGNVLQASVDPILGLRIKRIPALSRSIWALVLIGQREMYNEWTIELKAMADRIINMRLQLYDAFLARGIPGDWSHIIRQIGMFMVTGVNTEQAAFMTKEYHIYMTSDGKISMAGLSSKTVPHIADAIHAAVTGGF